MTETNTFENWMKELKNEVEKLPEQYKPFFDLRKTNLDCWREDFECGRTPVDVVEENVSDLLRSQ